MEKIDRVVALAGALVLLVAVAAAAMSEPAPERTWLLSPEPEVFELQGSIGAVGFPPSQASPSAQLPVQGPDVHAIHLNVTMRATGAFPPAGRVVVTLVAPDGTSHAQEAAPPAGGTTLTVPLDVLVAPMPAPRSTQAASAEEALQREAANGSRAGEGDWTLRVEYSSTAPPAGVEFAYSGTLVRWSVEAAPEAPQGK